MNHFQRNVVCFDGVRRLQRIEIENFKAIRKLDLDVPPPGDGESWLMFVGENATGKSSILQAASLALLGPGEWDARNFVSHGENKGAVRVYLPNVNEPMTVTFTRHSPHFTFTPKDPPRFNPTVRPQNGEQWLADRTKVSQRQFDRIALALRQLLMLTGNDAVIRDGGIVKVKFDGHFCSLPELSDGYRGIVALALDIVMSLGTEPAEGIVLIDEIETHLHPAWKLEIVARLRRVFPRLQFLATTHDPLCLRGLHAGEVVVLRRSGHDVSAELHTQSVDHLRADQLLTSPLFGLLTTRAPEFQRNTDRYAQLLGQSRRSAAEERDLHTLRTALGAGIQSSESPLAQHPHLPGMNDKPAIADEVVRNDIRRKLAEILA